MSTRQTIEVAIAHGTRLLMAHLTVPPRPGGIVIFAHGTGSSRHSPRNQHVARILEHAGFATLLLDLLTSGEANLDEQTLHYRFDIPLLAQRIVSATDWAAERGETHGLPVGYFGTSTGAAAAIVAATHRPRLVRAIVSRGGRPDLAGASLTSLWVPTLLIVGGSDETVLAVNREAGRKICGQHEVRVIPGATHLFEEPGALDEVAEMAAAWFREALHVGSKDTLGPEWDNETYEHVLEGSIVSGEDRNA